MGSRYLTEMADLFRQAGLSVVEYGGWKTRARSSGGYSDPKGPLCVMWHHTASKTTPERDAFYECHVADAKPICNVNIARDGTVWVLAAGATNTNGKGSSQKFSRGTVPTDSMNSYAFGIEIANNGVGEPYPQAQIDAVFVVSNVINKLCGNQPTDVCTHQRYAPDRKIDPARGEGTVQGTFHPREINSSGSWNLDDLRAECAARAGQKPPDPTPKPPSGSDWWTPLMESLPVLTPGMTGPFVKRMQHLIAAAGFMNEANVANYDSVFGMGTAAALSDFKASVGGARDNTCDAWTWGALMHTVDGIPEIKVGAQGSDVKRMQHLLAAAGFMNEANVGNYDGVWGGGTDGAKQRFDVAKGLTPSPPTDCGKKSWTALLRG